MTPEALQACDRKTLSTLAQQHGVGGHRGMRKAELVRALLRRIPAERPKSRRRKAPASGMPVERPPLRRGAAAGYDAAAARAPRRAGSGPNARRNLATSGSRTERFDVLVQDPFWLYAEWSLSSESIERATSALGSAWHSAVPVIRLHEIRREEPPASQERFVRDVEVHSRTDHWYVPADGPGHTYQAQLGFKSGTRFHAVARSAIISVPRHQPRAASGSPTAAGRRKHGGLPTSRVPARALNFSISTELQIQGQAATSATITIDDHHIPIAEDGRFALQVQLVEGRQVIPVVAMSADGLERRTVILAVDLNTKELAPESPDDL